MRDDPEYYDDDYDDGDDKIAARQRDATFSMSATLVILALLALVVVLTTGCEDQCDCDELLKAPTPEIPTLADPPGEHSIVVKRTQYFEVD